VLPTVRGSHSPRKAAKQAPRPHVRLTSAARFTKPKPTMGLEVWARALAQETFSWVPWQRAHRSPARWLPQPWVYTLRKSW
jgi:hypothetical protein